MDGIFEGRPLKPNTANIISHDLPEPRKRIKFPYTERCSLLVLPKSHPTTADESMSRRVSRGRQQACTYMNNILYHSRRAAMGIQKPSSLDTPPVGRADLNRTSPPQLHAASASAALGVPPVMVSDPPHTCSESHEEASSPMHMYIWCPQVVQCRSCALLALCALQRFVPPSMLVLLEKLKSLGKVFSIA